MKTETQRTYSARIWLLATMAILFQAQIHATLIGFDFSARVDSVYDDAGLLGTNVYAGQVGTGTFIYDSASQDSVPNSNEGHYDPPLSLTFQLGGFSFRSDFCNRSGRIWVINDQPFWGDTFFFESTSNLATVPAPFQAGTISMELRQFEASGATALTNDWLPQSLDLGQFDANNRFFSIEFGPGFQQVINLTVISVMAAVQVQSPRPSLQIVYSPPGVTLNWPPCYTNWVLETCAGFPTNNNWDVVTDTPSIVGSQLAVTNAAIEANRFYRLREQ